MTYEELRLLFPRSSAKRMKIWGEQLGYYCSIFDIHTPVRKAAFIAQIGHESMNLMLVSELWGPTRQQQKYEPPHPLAATLGNTQPGDGFKFRGRGLIQITGRSNYEQVSHVLGDQVNLLKNPDLLTTPQYAVKSACWWWQSQGLNQIADENTEESFKQITRIINGGLTGWDDRLDRWIHAKKILRA